MAKLDDLFSASMKQPRKLLDLSKVKIFCDADFNKYMDRVPELKLRPDNVEKEDVQIISDFSFTSPDQAFLQKQETITSSSSSKCAAAVKSYFFEDPLPLSMRGTRLEDLWIVDIHWKMLTSDRPPNRLEEGIFERLVDLGRFSLKARKQEQAAVKSIMSSLIGNPSATYLIAIGFITSRSRRGAMETRLKHCKNCGMELCTGALCKLFHYECFTRMILDKDELETQEKEEIAFLKEVSKSGAGGPSPSSAAAATTKKKAQKQQGKRLKMQIKKTKKKKRKKKKKTKENVEPVSAPD